MALKFQAYCPLQSFTEDVVFQSSTRRFPLFPSRVRLNYGIKHILYSRCNHRKGFFLTNIGKPSLSCTYFSSQRFILLAGSEDGVAVNGTSSLTGSEEELGKMRLKITQTLEGKDVPNDLVQCLHDTARVFELALEKQGLTRGPLFAKAWLGIDKNAWVKIVSYQASVHALLQALIESADRNSNQEINNIVNRSMKQLCSILEEAINDELFLKDAAACDWFWSQQHPPAVANFVNLLEKDSYVPGLSSIKMEGDSIIQKRGNDSSIFKLFLSTIAALMKLGAGKISCPQFSSALKDTSCKIMKSMSELMSIDKVYHSTTEMGLQREFLIFFGPQAASYKNRKDLAEAAFWVDLVQQQLQRAIDRERIWARLTTYESIEVLGRDLAIFGFFVALGRKSQSYLEAAASDFVDESLSSFLRYLVGGCIIFYPQLSSVSTYQLFVEVVSEVMDWIPFYPDEVTEIEDSEKHRAANSRLKAAALVLDTCSHWVQDFIKYSVWLENPSNVKAATFLSSSHEKLDECRASVTASTVANTQQCRGEVMTNNEIGSEGKLCAGIEENNSFEKELEGVDMALNRLEGLLKEVHVCSSNSDKEHLEAACTDLERIRKLKKEVEFLEASLKAKATSLQQDLEEDDYIRIHTARKRKPKNKSGKVSQANQNIKDGKRCQGSLGSVPHGLRDFILSHSTSKKGLDEDHAVSADNMEDLRFEENNSTTAEVSKEIRLFKQLQNELFELERRVQENNGGFMDEKGDCSENSLSNNGAPGSETAKLVIVRNDDNLIGKSMGKLKEAGWDVLQGTQLLATDIAAAMVLIRRGLTGDELTEKEKKTLMRTLTDVASVIPIGILMLLPVTAVGHAAMLAAIKRYVPALIPSAYARERLELLRQLEKIKEMEMNSSKSDEGSREVSNIKLNAASDKTENY